MLWRSQEGVNSWKENQLTIEAVIIHIFYIKWSQISQETYDKV